MTTADFQMVRCTVAVSAVTDIVWEPGFLQYSSLYHCLPGEPDHSPGFLISGAPPVCLEQYCVEIWLQLQKGHAVFFFFVIITTGVSLHEQTFEFHNLISAGLSQSRIPVIVDIFFFGLSSSFLYEMNLSLDFFSHWQFL